MSKSAFERVRWPAWIIAGVALQLIGAFIAAYGWWSNNPEGYNRHSGASAWSGGLIGWVGFWMMVIGVIALGVRVARELPDSRSPGSGSWSGSGGASPAGLDLSADPAPFGVHPGDSDLVADVRRELRLGRSRSEVRKLVRRSAREQRLDKDDHAIVEALLAESDRRAAG